MSELPAKLAHQNTAPLQKVFQGSQETSMLQ